MSDSLSREMNRLYFTPDGEEVLFMHSIVHHKSLRYYKFMRANGFVKLEIMGHDSYYNLKFNPEKRLNEKDTFEMLGLYVHPDKNIKEVVKEISGGMIIVSTALPALLSFYNTNN